MCIYFVTQDKGMACTVGWDLNVGGVADDLPLTQSGAIYHHVFQIVGEMEIQI